MKTKKIGSKKKRIHDGYWNALTNFERNMNGKLATLKLVRCIFPKTQFFWGTLNLILQFNR